MPSVQPENGRIVYSGSDFQHPIWFCFSRESLHHIVQNQPRSALDGLVRFWPNTSGPEASQCAKTIGPSFWQNATRPLSVSRFQTRSRVQNQVGFNLVLADCVRFWLSGSGPEAIRCARIIRPTSGQCFQADPDWMQIESSMFTGYTAQNLVQRLFSACTSTHTNVHFAHTSIITDYTQLNSPTNSDLGWGKAAARSRRHGRSIVLEKRTVSRSDLMESRVGVFQTGRTRSFHAEGPKTL